MKKAQLIDIIENSNEGSDIVKKDIKLYQNLCNLSWYDLKELGLIFLYQAFKNGTIPQTNLAAYAMEVLIYRCEQKQLSIF